MSASGTQDHLAWALQKIASLQGGQINPLQLEMLIQRQDAPHATSDVLAFDRIASVCEQLNLPPPVPTPVADEALLPLLCFQQETGWGVLLERTIYRAWLVQYPAEEKLIVDDAHLPVLFEIHTERDLGLQSSAKPTFKSTLNHSLRRFNGVLLEACLATLFIGLFAMVTSLFSMQVYDRVIPIRSEATLAVLFFGVCITIVLEFLLKLARSRIMDSVVQGLDAGLSREIFEQLLKIRLDQLPASVGSLASQIRGYEQIRSFYTAGTLFAIVDVPVGILFLLVIAIIGSPVLAVVVLIAAALALFAGFLSRVKLKRLAEDGAQHTNLKTGQLVEAVEGAETIKAGAGSWKFLSKWIEVNAKSIQNDMQMRGVSDGLNYSSALLQQISYAALVAVGAWIVMRGEMTMGGLIACSILSGRVLSPILALPGLIVQHSHVQAALKGLERLYELKVDNDSIAKPLQPEFILGAYTLRNMRYSYSQNNVALEIPTLEIRPGESIAVLGPIGSGKSTLLKILAGLYSPTQGKVLLDGLDMNHVYRPIVAKKIGYLQQEHRLFHGTLRENLLVGLSDPGDEVLIDAMKRTGMIRFVQADALGLDRVISEGGKGLSGGQRQLLAFTRVFLCNPAILLLDEPTASMDEEQEHSCLRLMAEEVTKGKTLLVVTHKPNVLQIVDRVIVVMGNKIVLDGPKDQVLQKLGAKPHQSAEVR